MPANKLAASADKLKMMRAVNERVSYTYFSTETNAIQVALQDVSIHFLGLWVDNPHRRKGQWYEGSELPLSLRLDETGVYVHRLRK